MVIGIYAQDGIFITVQELNLSNIKTHVIHPSLHHQLAATHHFNTIHFSPDSSSVLSTCLTSSKRETQFTFLPSSSVARRAPRSLLNGARSYQVADKTTMSVTIPSSPVACQPLLFPDVSKLMSREQVSLRASSMSKPTSSTT